MSEVTQARVANWIQFALLLFSIFALAMHGEGRLARVEQQLMDAERDRKDLVQRIGRIEDKLETWSKRDSSSR